MRRYVFRIAMLTLAVLAGGSVRASDQDIAAQIIEKLQAEKQAGTLKGFSIDMQVDEGTVWLSGRVANSTQQAKALDIARRIPGVVQVVNDLEVSGPPAPPAAPKAAPTPARSVAAQPVSTKSVEPAPAEEAKPASLPVTIQASSIPATPIAATSVTATPLPAPTKSTASSKARTAQAEPKKSSAKPALLAQDASFKSGAVGSGVSEANASTPANGSLSVVQAAQPIANVPQTLPSAGAAQPIHAAGPQALPAPFAGSHPYAMIPVFAGSQSQVPLAFAPARTVNHTGGPEGVQGVPGGMPGGPQPMYMPGSGVGIAPARYDHPQMPGYAWPSYAAHPNYAAVTYPKQYSPTAWPYIGPFYPYPQVPLGWRKVTMEWDDGWWVLDFKDRRTMYNHN